MLEGSSQLIYTSINKSLQNIVTEATLGKGTFSQVKRVCKESVLERQCFPFLPLPPCLAGGFCQGNQDCNMKLQGTLYQPAKSLLSYEFCSQLKWQLTLRSLSNSYSYDYSAWWPCTVSAYKLKPLQPVKMAKMCKRKKQNQNQPFL